MVTLEPGDLPSVLTLPWSPNRFRMDRCTPHDLDFFIGHTRMLTSLSKDPSRSTDQSLLKQLSSLPSPSVPPLEVTFWGE